MSWVDDLVGLGGDVVDMVGEVGTTAAKAWGESQGAKGANASEVASQPETAQNREPVKGTNADGTPIVVAGSAGTTASAAVPTNSQMIAGIDNKYLLLAAVVLISLVAFMPARGRR